MTESYQDHRVCEQKTQNAFLSSSADTPSSLKFTLRHQPGETSTWGRARSALTWVPPWCRFDPENPPVFSLWHNTLFAFAGAFTVANLYYNQPILDILAREFDVNYETVSRIPTLMQAGYATGLLFLCPLGDLVRRRPFVLIMVFFSASIWCVDDSCDSSCLFGSCK